MESIGMLNREDLLNKSLVFSNNGGGGDKGKGGVNDPKKNLFKILPNKILDICRLDPYSGKILCSHKRNLGVYCQDTLIFDPVNDWEREYFRTKNLIDERYVNSK
jgi:hypothetical protein